MSYISASLPDVFLPYQQELWRAIDENDVTAIEKSRRTGYSWALGGVAAGQAGLKRADGGSDVLYMGYEREMTREFIDYVAMWAKSFQLAASDVQEFMFVDPDRPETQIGAFRIKFASGFEVIALPSVARALRGKQGLVILDEAAFMDDLEAVLKAALALLIWGGRVVICSTHNGETNPFNALVNDVRAGRVPYKLLRCTFDEAVEQGLYRRICFVQGKPWTPKGEAEWVAGIYAQYRDNADEELRVIPNPSTGVFLPRVLIEARSTPDIPVLRWTAPAGFKLWPEHLRRAELADWCEREVRPVLEALDPREPMVFGSDFGRIRDLTVDWFLGIGRDLVRRTRLVIELRDVPHEQQRQVLHYVLDRLAILRGGIMDAGGNGSYLGEVTMQSYGERVQPLQLTDAWYREHMPPLRAAFEDATIVVPADRDIHDDLGSLRLVRGVARVPERRLNDQGASRHGDAAIACALAYAASRAEHEEYAYQGGLKALRGPSDGNRWRDRPPEQDQDDDGPPPRGWTPELRGGAFA